jgi:hypothetical protein
LRKSVLVLLVLAIALFGESLLNLIQYMIGINHFILTGLVVSIGMLILSLAMLRKPLWLMAIVPMEGELLRSYEQKIQRNAMDARAYLSKIGILMRLVSYDCERMKYFLSWGTDGVPLRDIRPRIHKNLERIDTMLQTLETAYRLNPFGLLATNSRFTSSWESRLARNRLEDFKRLFPAEVEKTPFDQPVYLLVEALHMLCAAIALNPLYAEAFESAAGLMEYLQRQELAEKCRQVAANLERRST